MVRGPQNKIAETKLGKVRRRITEGEWSLEKLMSMGMEGFYYRDTGAKECRTTTIGPQEGE